MNLFKRQPKVVTPPLSLQITHAGISMEGFDNETSLLLAQFWVQEFGEVEESKRVPTGFSNAHMRELESDTEIARLGELEDIEDEDEEDDE